MTAAPPASAKPAGRKEWIALCILCLPLMVVSMDVSVLFFAAPAIAADLQPTATQQLWIFDVYGFILAGLLLTMGAVGDRIGRRRLLMIGSVGFALSSLFAAYAHTAETLIVARGILGIAGSTLMPSTLALVRTMFQDPAQRTKAMSVWSAVMASGVTVGPIIGGLLLDSFSWGAVFLINIPAMALLLLVAPFLLPESRSSDVRSRIDVIGSILVLAAVLPVTYGVKTLAEDGWATVPAVLLAAGLLAGIVFVRRQLTVPNPLIDIRALMERRTGGSILVNLIATFTLMASALVNTQFLQSVLGYSPFVASLWSVAPSIVVGAAVPLAAKLSLAHGRPRVMAGGFALSAIGFLVLTQVRLESFSPLVVMLVGAGLVAAGIVSVMTLVTDYVVGVAPADRAGAVGGLIETSSELGGAFGIALLGCVLAAVYRHVVSPLLPSDLAPDAARAAGETIAGASAAARQLPAEAASRVMDASREAFMTAMHVTCLVSGVILLLAAAVTVVLLRDKKTAVNAAA
ncbi:MFS transporter [Paenibacillus flagellatus]|uniref:MFS transporter n=1 Tax=Paenibacillus flagellatus TaxID=2211139 RepID=A0A2V5KPF8_9BACL|nr:MFS transporter [Paenibacillus flagellatus]PYI53067.1 MFS transporter [Paenibacillus flagellatus]